MGQGKRWGVAGAFALALLLGLAAPVVSAPTTEVITIGTLVPASSPWGEVFKGWAQKVKQQTKGGVELQFFGKGQQGDEPPSSRTAVNLYNSAEGRLVVAGDDPGADAPHATGRYARPHGPLYDVHETLPTS